MWSDHDSRASVCIKVKLSDCSLDQSDVCTAALFLRPQEYDADVRSGWIGAKIGKSLVAGDQPALLALHTLPHSGVREATPSLSHHRPSIVTVSSKNFGDLWRKIFVYLEARRHCSPATWRGTKSALLTASAANFNAALTSSIVNCGYANNTCSGVSPSPRLPAITLTGTRVPLIHGSPW